MADGFFGNYEPNFKKVHGSYKKLLLRKKRNNVDDVFTDNPPIRRSTYTSDENESDDERLKVSKENENKENPILPVKSSDSDQKDRKNNRMTKQPINRKPVSDTLVDLETDSDERAKHADTLIDSSDCENDEEKLCTRMSDMQVQRKQQAKITLREPLSDTVLNTESEDSQRSPLQEIPLAMEARKSLFRSNLLQDNVLIKDEPTRDNKSNSDRSEYSDDAIEVLDSEDEGEIDALLQPAEQAASDSWINCSSSNGTINEFFNNPPSINPNLAITHSMIHRHKVQQKIQAAQLIKKNNPPVLLVNKAPKVIQVQKPTVAVINKLIPEIPHKMSDETEETDWEKALKLDEILTDQHVEIGPTDESDVENDDDHIVDLTLDDSGPATSQEQQQQQQPNVIKATRSCENMEVEITQSKPPQQINSKRTPQPQNDPKQTPQQQHDLKRTQSLSKSTPKILSEDKKISITPSSKSKSRGITNIKIKLDLKISVRNGSSSEDEKSRISTSPNSSPNVVAKESIEIDTSVKKNKRKTSTMRENQSAGSQENIMEMIENDNRNSFHTPSRKPETDNAVIDDDLQSVLTNLYGEKWRTPQLLKSCKSKRVRENLRKSIFANNFESFVKNLPNDDHESTRLPSSSRSSSQESIENASNQFLKPPKPMFGNAKRFESPSSLRKTASERKPKVAKTKVKTHLSDNDDDDDVNKNKTPIRKAQSQILKTSIKQTPRLQEICDPDTSSAEDSGDDFNPDDTWNASSDEEYATEKDRIAKRQSVIHVPRSEEIIFIRDDSIEEQQKFEELLRKYEFKKPIQFESGKKVVTKRKLFNHTHYEEEEIQITSIDNKENDDDLKSPLSWLPKKTPTKDSDKKVTPKTSRPIEKLTSSKKKDLVRCLGGPMSFLKSLDAEANRSICDADALFYRNNYKTKKQELAVKLFKMYNEKVFDSKLSDVQIKWNKKLQTTGGRCSNSRRNGVRQSFLELSDKVLTSADRLRCTLIHEMCHAATWIFSGENGHGSTWKQWTIKANRAFPELPKINVCHSYVIEYRYTYLCVDCKAQSKTHSKSKKVEEIRCSICKGKIQLFENKKNEKGEIQMVPVQKKEVTGFAKFVQLKYKEVKVSSVNHKDAMNILSQQFKQMSVDEKAKL